METSEAGTPEGTSIESMAGPEQVQTIEQWLDYVVQNLDGVWTEWFTSNGYQEPDVWYWIVSPGSQSTTACDQPDGSPGPWTVPTNYSNVFYCPADVNADSSGAQIQGAIHLPVETMQGIWNGSVPGSRLGSGYVGDFQAAYVVAHEFGHHVEHELAEQARTQRPAGAWKELIADCFAGNWTASSYSQGILEAGDYEEAIRLSANIGDLPGTRDPHGSGPHRAGAFSAGYHGVPEHGYGPGDPRTCIAYYWRFDQYLESVPLPLAR